MSISEAEIRSALLKRLTRVQKTSYVQQELRVDNGSSRIDIAVIGKKLIGYEIKSDADTFQRFSNQIHSYNRIFDHITLVCGSKHAEAAEKVIPAWWGLFVAQRNQDGVVVLDKIRDACKNPKQDSFSLASMLWKEEAIQFLDGKIASKTKHSSSSYLWEQIAVSFPLTAIKLFVIETLIKRLSSSTPSM